MNPLSDKEVDSLVDRADALQNRVPGSIMRHAKEALDAEHDAQLVEQAKHVLRFAQESQASALDMLRRVRAAERIIKRLLVARNAATEQLMEDGNVDSFNESTAAANVKFVKELRETRVDLH